ncbi:MAG: hypothetical protein EZS28_024299 [Streblomastix strix]|uniref:Uncharacterized protein n=1 Tax=Streblomastix strix TaxID=222440 RepID=A0A5J4VCU3_9EUKA|nr:MAG: hypothetical protein EZS28_024299 [Streblomastix strix]
MNCFGSSSFLLRLGYINRLYSKSGDFCIFGGQIGGIGVASDEENEADDEDNQVYENQDDEYVDGVYIDYGELNYNDYYDLKVNQELYYYVFCIGGGVNLIEGSIGYKISVSGDLSSMYVLIKKIKQLKEINCHVQMIKIMKIILMNDQKNLKIQESMCDYINFGGYAGGGGIEIIGGGGDSTSNQFVYSVIFAKLVYEDVGDMDN